MSDNRSINTRRNIVSGVIYKVITIILPFLIRTVILYILGEQFVGLSGLFTSILQVLNLAELGFSNAVVYNMYKPIADKDDDKVCALIALYKKIYEIIGTVILVAGIAIMPFLPYLIKGTWPNEINIYFLYILYLVNTVISYFVFAYKSALLNALQRMDLVNVVISVIYVLKYIIQLGVLVIFKNFYLYVVIGIIATVVNNIVTAYIADKKYSSYVPRGKIVKDEINGIKKQVTALMICKISDTSRNSFDSIALSMLFGLTQVAIYNNYFYIFSSVYGVMLVITQAMQASVGNSIASETIMKNYNDLRKFQFIFSWIVSWCFIAMLCLYQPFMRIWVGEALILSEFEMMMFCIYFYCINMNNMRNLYFSGNGLWWAAKISFLLESAFNLVLNFVLGYLWGITGILVTTILTIVVFNFIARTNVLFREYFHISPREYYFDHVRYLIVTFCVGGCTYLVTQGIMIEGLLGFFFRTVICILVPNILFFVVYRNMKVYREAKDMALGIIKARNK